MKNNEIINKLESLPGEASDFIKLVIKKTRYRRSVRNDVAHELVCHFEDALHECEDDKQRQQAAKKLIEEFGKPKQLAKLIRRGKKRCRPLWRKVLTKCWQAILLFLILYPIWFFSGSPKITTDYVELMNEAVKPKLEIDNNLNAFPLYERAAKEVEAIQSETSDYYEIFDSNYSSATPEDIIQIKNKLTEHSSALQLTMQAAVKPYLWQKYKTGPETANDNAIQVILPYMSERMKLSKMLQWKAFLDYESENFEESINSLIASYRIGKHLEGDRLIIEQLVGIVIKTSTAQRALELARLKKTSEDFISNLQYRIRQEYTTSNYDISYVQEKLMILDETQRCFTDSRILGSHLHLKRLTEAGYTDLAPTDDPAELSLYALKIITQPGKKKTQQQLVELYDEISEISIQTPAALHQSKISIDDKVMETIKSNGFLGIFVPALTKLHLRTHENQCEIEAALTILSIIIYEKQTGIYPENLKALVNKGLIDKLPIDPFSNESLIYRKTDGSFTLYSIGRNFTDDNGTSGHDRDNKPRDWAENGDRIFWPVPQDSQITKQ